MQLRGAQVANGLINSILASTSLLNGRWSQQYATWSKSICAAVCVLLSQASRKPRAPKSINGGAKSLTTPRNYY